MRLSFEMRPTYAFVGVSGPVEVADAAGLRETAAAKARAHESMRLMLDLRDAQLSRDARDAVLGWARAPHASASAIVTEDDLFVAEVNMAALASSAKVRAFAGSSDAHRWLSRGSVSRDSVVREAVRDLARDGVTRDPGSSAHDSGRGLPRPVLDAETRRRALFGQLNPPSESPAPPTSPPPDRMPRRSASVPAMPPEGERLPRRSASVPAMSPPVATPTERPMRSSTRPPPMAPPSGADEPPPSSYPRRPR
jgi:hypothetical protein